MLPAAPERREREKGTAGAVPFLSLFAVSAGGNAPLYTSSINISGIVNTASTLEMSAQLAPMRVSPS